MNAPLTRTLRTALAAALCTAALAAPAAAEDHVDVVFGSEPGQAGFGFVPATVAPEEVLVVLIDRSGPVVAGVVLLTGGRSVEFAAVESRPFAIVEAYDAPVIAFAEK